MYYHQVRMKQKISCLIVDDESKGRRVIRSICEEYCPHVEVVGEADTVFAAEALIRKLSPDFIFLDIRMPLKDGFQLIESLSDIEKPRVVFTTAYDQYAVKAFKVSAIDYLLKPIDIDDLLAAVDKVRKSIEHEGHGKSDSNQGDSSKDQKDNRATKIAFVNSDGYVFLDPELIIRCEAYGNYTKVFLTDHEKPTLISKSLKHFEEILEEYNFFRVHKSHIVNLDHIDQFLRGKPAKLVMTDSSEVEVSIRKRDELIDKLL